jgi:hypothetical protein
MRWAYGPHSGPVWNSPIVSARAASPWSTLIKLDSPIAVMMPTAAVQSSRPNLSAAWTTFCAFASCTPL